MEGPEDSPEMRGVEKIMEGGGGRIIEDAEVFAYICGFP